MEEILRRLESIQKDVTDIKGMISGMPRERRTELRKKSCTSQRLLGGLRDPQIRSAIVRHKLDGRSFLDIAAYIREYWPGQPEKWPSKSAIHRFWQNVKDGRLVEYGINPPDMTAL